MQKTPSHRHPVRPRIPVDAGFPPELVTAADHIASGKLSKAEQLLRSYVHDNPGDVNGIRMLGEVGLSLGALRDAHQLLERAVEIAPDYHAARYALANVLYKRHRYSEALTHLNLLLQSDPDDAAWLTLKAANLVEMNEHEKAIPLLERIIEQHPQHKQAYLSYGHALRAVGSVDDAIIAYEQCIELGSGPGEAFWSLANLKTYRFSDEQIEQIETLLNNPECPFRDYYHLLFTLGKAREDRGEFEQAMAAYVKGNEVRGKNVPWDSKQFHLDTQELKRFFTADYFKSVAGAGFPADDPIFIVGLPRAGSTLLEQILASHSQVEGTAELADIIALARSLSGKTRRDDPSRYPSVLAELEHNALRDMGEQYINSTRTQRITGKPRFIDKMPNNFSHVGLICSILPNARIIDARRHPLDCCFSGYKQLFASGQGFTYGLEKIGRYYRDYVDMMAHWDRVLPGKVLRVHYEDMVTDTEAQVRRLLDFCQLPFEESCLQFHTNQRTVRTASSEQVRQPIYQSGMNQWQPFEQWLEPLKRGLGPALAEYPSSGDDSTSHSATQ